MTDTASLIVSVDSTGAEKSISVLDRLAQQAQKTENSVNSLLSEFAKRHILNVSVGAETAKINEASRAVDNFSQSVRNSEYIVDEFGNVTTRTFERLQADMNRQIALYGETSRAAKLAYDIEHRLVEVATQDQRELLLAQARRLDAMDNAASTFNRMSAAERTLHNQTTRTTGGFNAQKGAVQQLGFQLQDVIVQLQMGTNAGFVLAQQGSQIASIFGAGGAVVGAFIALAGVIGGLVVPAIMGFSSNAEELEERIKDLNKETNNLVEAQKIFLQLQSDNRIKQYEKDIESLTETVSDLERNLRNSETQAKLLRNSITGGFGQLPTNTGAIEEKLIGLRAELATKNQELEKEEKDLEETLNGSSKEIEKQNRSIEQLIESLEDERASLTLNKEQMATYIADKSKATGANYDLIRSLHIEIEALREKKAEEKEEERLRKKKIDDLYRLAKQEEEAEKRRKQSIADTTTALKREADLFNITSRAAQLEYDIKNNILKVEGGIAGLEAQRLLVQAERLDQLEAERKIREAIDKLTSGKLFDGMDKGEIVGGITSELEKSANRVNEAWVDLWMNLDQGFDNLTDSIKDSFERMLAEMAHMAITKPITVQIQQRLAGLAGGGASGGASGGLGNAAGAIGAGGIYAAAALAVVAAVGIWNKKQDEKFVKMTSEYRQGTQSLGTILGEQNKKSESIANLTDLLQSTAKDTLSVNYEMWKTLVDIRTGITGVASGFAKTNIGQNNINVSTGTSTFGFDNAIRNIGDASIGAFSPLDPLGLEKLIGPENKVVSFIQGFMGTITTSISEAIYKKKTKVTDTGIEVLGQSLADILESGMLDAYAYADINIKKKFLGVTTSNRMRRETEALGDVLSGQLADVFINSGALLEQASETFGIDFDSFVNRLTIPLQSLSLKDLTGEELIKEIESFFSSTLDNWAGVLLTGTDILNKYQEIGEGAFETFVRLAAETELVLSYVDSFNLTLSQTGIAAVDSIQDLANLAGGFEELSGSLTSFGDKFFSETDKFLALEQSVTDYYNNLNLTVPETREEFKNLVQSLDLATQSGRDQFAALMNVVNATDQYLTALEKEEKAKEDLFKESISNAYSALQRAIQAESKELESQIDIVSSALEKSRTVADLLAGTLDGLIIDSNQVRALNRRQAQSQLDQALAIARAGGGLPDPSKLEQALTALSQPSAGLFSSFNDYIFDFYKTANVIRELEQEASEQVSIEEKTLNNLEEQLTSLDNLLEEQKKQVDILNGIDVTVLSVKEALNNLAFTIDPTKSVTRFQIPVRGEKNNDSFKAVDPAVKQSRTDIEKQKQAEQKKQEQAAIQNQELNSLLRDFIEYVKASQYSIGDSALKQYKIFKKWDVEGIPPEREAL